MVSPSSHMIGRWFMPTSNKGSAMPRVTATKATWTSDSCADHPEPARFSADMTMPRLLWPLLGIEEGAAIRCFVKAAGQDEVASPSGPIAQRRAKHVAYFEGEVEGVELTPTRGGGFVSIVNLVQNIPEYSTVGVRWGKDEPVTLTNFGDDHASITFRLFFRLPLTNQDITSYTSGGKYGGGRLYVTHLGRNMSGPEYSPTIEYSQGATKSTNAFNIPAVTSGEWAWVDVYVGDLRPGEVYQFVFMAYERNTGKPEGYRVRIVGGDYLAKMGRTYIGADPWTAQTAAVRLYYQLGNALDGRGVPFDWHPRNDFAAELGSTALMDSARVRPRDVDNVSALEVYRQTVSSVGRVAIGLAGRVGISWALAPPYFTKIASNGVAVKEPYHAAVSTLPSDVVPMGPVGKSIDRITTRFFANFYNPGDEYPTKGTDVKERTSTFEDNPDAIKRYGVVARKFETELWSENTSHGLDSLSPALWSKLYTMAAEQSVSRYYFTTSLEVMPRQIERIEGLAELVDNSTRFGRLFRFTGPLPPMIDRTHRMKGGAFGFENGRWMLSIESEPANYSGVDAVRFDRAKTSTTTLANLKGANDYTIDDLRSVYSL